MENLATSSLQKRRGNPNWKPGQSGNPAGRPKEDPELVEACKTHTKAAIKTLVYWMNQRKDGKAAIQAARELLDRAYGKPAQAIVGPDGSDAVRVTIRHLFAKAEEPVTIENTPPPEIVENKNP
jgi:hypothetical protein